MPPASHTDLQMVLTALESVFHVNPTEIFHARRAQHLAWPRQVGMVAMMQQFGHSSAFAAAAFQRRARGTAMHAARAVAKRATTSPIDRQALTAFLLRLAECRKNVSPNTP